MIASLSGQHVEDEEDGCFYDETEAAIWCYAQLRHDYGKELAEKELGAKLN